MRRYLFIVALVLSSATHADDAPRLPPSGFDHGWMKHGQPKIFTSSDLYGYINGGAELFLEFGFETLTIQRYKNGDEELHIEMYRMSDQTGAHGVFLMKCGAITRDTTLEEFHTINHYQLLLQRHRYFIIVANQSGSARVASTMLRAARALCEKLEPNEDMPLLSNLATDHRVPNSLRLLRGPYALQSIYTLGDGNILQLTNNLTAVAADYRTDDESYTMISVTYPDTLTAERVYHFIHDKLDEHLKEMTFDENRMTFQDYSGQFGVILLDRNTLTMRLHLKTNPN